MLTNVLRETAVRANVLSMGKRICGISRLGSTRRVKPTLWTLCCYIELIRSDSVLQALFILECYRVIVLQRSMLSPRELNSELNVTTQERLELLFTPNSSIDHHAIATPGILELAIIATFGLPFTPFSRNATYSSTRWRPEFATMVLDRWARVRVLQEELSTVLLYHFVCINMHARLDLLQHFVRTHSSRMSTNRASDIGSTELRDWSRTMDCTISHWHARRILQLAQSNTLEQSNRVGANASRVQKLQEAPHVPYSIYFATLVLWCGAMYETPTTPESTLHLHLGIAALSGLRVRVANLLAQALREVTGPGSRPTSAKE